MTAGHSGVRGLHCRESDFRGLIHKEFTPTLFPVTGDKPSPCEILEPVGAGGMGFCDARWWIPG